MKSTVLLLSCEHAVNTVPPDYQCLFSSQEALLSSDQAYDPGALEITQYLGRELNCPVTYGAVSKLLVDCNLDPEHPECFSSWTLALTPEQKQQLIQRYHQPFCQQTQTYIREQRAQNRQVLHLSIHSFNCAQKKGTQNTAISFLYEPSRHGEREVVRLMKSVLLTQQPHYRIRVNYPRCLHKANFQHMLRHHFAEADYLGIALEINQLLVQQPESLKAMMQALSQSLQELMQVL